MHTFQELDSDDEKNGVALGQGFQPPLHSTNLNDDELYFNDMDIRAWERRSAAFDDGAHGPYHGYQDEDEGYYEDSGELINHADHEEMLFQRVLDKIRIARAAGNVDVQLSPEELEAYQSKLHGGRTPAARSPQSSRPATTAFANDNASVASVSSSSKHGHSSRSKKPQRSSIFASKPKKDKEKPSSRKRTSTMTSVSPQAPPGFVVPGPDGQPMYAPINAYQGSLLRDPGPAPAPGSRSVSGNSYQVPAQPSTHVPVDIVGAFPGSEQIYRPASPPVQSRKVSSRQLAYEREHQPVTRSRSPSIHSAARMVPFPVEPYQYHAFSPASASPTSPPPQYARRVSSGPSEASYASVPRRVPVPVSVPTPAPVPLPRAMPVVDAQYGQYDPTLAALASGSAAANVAGQGQGVSKGSVGKDGERRRKSGKRTK